MATALTLLTLAAFGLIPVTALAALAARCSSGAELRQPVHPHLIRYHYGGQRIR